MMYSLIYNEELEVVDELKMMFQDFMNIVCGDGSKPRKKMKKSKEDDRKPIHVLVDIFIGLMTKAPQFLRQSIESLYL